MWPDPWNVQTRKICHLLGQINISYAELGAVRTQPDKFVCSSDSLCVAGPTLSHFPFIWLIIFAFSAVKNALSEKFLQNSYWYCCTVKAKVTELLQVVELFFCERLLVLDFIVWFWRGMRESVMKIVASCTQIDFYDFLEREFQTFSAFWTRLMRGMKSWTLTFLWSKFRCFYFD